MQPLLPGRPSVPFMQLWLRVSRKSYVACWRRSWWRRGAKTSKESPWRGQKEKPLVEAFFQDFCSATCLQKSKECVATVGCLGQTASEHKWTCLIGTCTPLQPLEPLARSSIRRILLMTLRGMNGPNRQGPRDMDPGLPKRQEGARVAMYLGRVCIYDHTLQTYVQ